MSKRMTVDLMPCPDCGSPPHLTCEIRSFPAREPGEKNTVQARCTNCDFLVVVSTNAIPPVIRKFWNVRTR